MKNRLKKLTLSTTLLGLSSGVYATGIQGVDIEELVVTGTKQGLRGDALSASVGTVTAEQLAFRPLLRPAEIMETVPGLIVTQHSGDGKANQYFLRGFNLDHGTDFSSFVDGIPINNVTHGHGQGYTDLNFIIPELVDNLVYKKGPYYAQEGDFSSAGSGRITLKKQLDHNVLRMTLGADDYRRLLVMNQVALGEGQLITAVEYQQTDGPWALKEALARKNIVLKYSQTAANNSIDIALMAYEAQWTATDQIPQRLVDSGELDRFSYVTDTSGGDTHRYSVSVNSVFDYTAYSVTFNGYIVDYALQLTSNPTYFLNDPINGDEFTQFDERVITGGGVEYLGSINTFNQLHVGLNIRNDNISDVGVGPSQNGKNTSYVVRNEVMENAAATFVSLTTQWLEKIHTTVGVRYDAIYFDVKQTGSDSDAIASPKFSLQLGPWVDTEYFVNYGKSFHSNDVRGVIANQNPVPLFAKSEGAEIGLRSALLSDSQISLAVFALDLESELVFVGDDGTTEPRGASRRTGWELGIYYQPREWLIVDMDVTESKAFFKEQLNGHSERVPDAVERVMSFGLSAELPNGWHGGLRWRYLGGRALTEDNSVRSNSTSIVNVNAGYRFKNGVAIAVDLINALDEEANDISYLFESLTAEEAAMGSTPVLDKHFHPVEPRTLRLTTSYEF